MKRIKIREVLGVRTLLRTLGIWALTSLACRFVTVFTSIVHEHEILGMSWLLTLVYASGVVSF